jgi:hypothetical protein
VHPKSALDSIVVTVTWTEKTTIAVQFS